MIKQGLIAISAAAMAVTATPALADPPSWAPGRQLWARYQVESPGRQCGNEPSTSTGGPCRAESRGVTC